ncbi:MAG: hypothetical protein MUF19_03440 [Candidatus Pacebacteria bacterium]|jgi:hypothetical protein|nr:hypothetical protein [Candidatus Paceibacterota bacterium]
MATSGYTDYGAVDQNSGGVAGDFIARQKERPLNGIRNVEAKVGDRSRKTIEQGTQYIGRGTARVGKRLKEQAIRMEESGQAGVTTAAMKRSGEVINKAGRLVNAASRGFAFKNKVVTKSAVWWAGGVAAAFTVISYPMGIIALGALGAVGAITYLPGGETIVETVLWFVTGSDIDIWVFAMIFYIFHFFLIIATYLTVYTILKLSGLQPVHGTASGLKSLALIGSLIISLVPGANFVPWIWGWLFIVLLYPN